MKIAACFTAGAIDAAATVNRMALGQVHVPHQTIQTRQFHGGAVAFVDSRDRPLTDTLVVDDGEHLLLAITGVPLAPGGGSITQKLAAWARLDFRQCIDALTTLDGAFVAMVWDRESGKVALVPDFLGMQPFFVATTGEAVLLASELTGIAASGLVDVQMDPAGLGAFFSFGHAIGERTMLRGVARPHGGMVHVLDLATARWERHDYWQWPADNKPIPVQDLDSERLVDAWRSDARRYADYAADSLLLLSGGFDSRLLLALAMELGMRPQALAVGHARELTGADGRFAARVARQFDIPLTVVESPADFYQSADYLRYLRQSACSTTSLYLFIAQVARHVSPDFGAVWEGVFPGGCIRPPAKFLQDRRQLGAPVGSGLWLSASAVLAPGMLQAAREEYDALLRAERNRYPNNGDGAKQFFSRNRTRNRTAMNPLTVYANQALPFTPGLNRQAWETNVSVVTKGKGKEESFVALMRRHFPELLRVPFVSGGDLFGPNAWDPATAIEHARARWLRLQQRARGSRWSPAFRTGPSASPWVETGMVERVVLAVDPDHGGLDPDGVRRVQAALGSPESRGAAHVLFYWQVWHWIMRGELTDERIECLTSPDC